MSSLNQVNLIGNLTADPQSKTTPSGSLVVNFSIATNRRYKDGNGEYKEVSQFHNIVAWSFTAKFVQQYIKKGAKVYVGGRLETRSWENKNGDKQYRTEVIAESVQSLDRGDSRPQHQRHPRDAEVKDVDYNDMDAPEKEEPELDDLPF